MFPLDNSSFSARSRPPKPDRRQDGVYVFGRRIGHWPWKRIEHPEQVVHYYSITADVGVPDGGGDGMIATEGGRFGLYLLKGKPVFDFTYDGPGVAKGGTGVLKVDGQAVENKENARTIPFLLPVDETFDAALTPARR